MGKIQILYKNELRNMNKAIDALYDKCARCSDLLGKSLYYSIFYIKIRKPTFCKARIPVAMNYDEDVAAILITDGTDPKLVAQDIIIQLGYSKKGKIVVFDKETYDAFNKVNLEGFEKPKIILCEIR